MIRDVFRLHSMLSQKLIGEKEMTDKRYFYKATILRVIDGDTLDCLLDVGFDILIKQRLRLSGINTPESRTRDKREKELGLEAKQFTQDFVSEGEKILIHTIKKGKFGRLLCEVFVGGKSLNKALIKAGLAREYHGGKRTGWFQ